MKFENGCIVRVFIMFMFESCTKIRGRAVSFLSKNLKKIFSITDEYINSDSGIALKKYRVVRILFFKFKSRQPAISGENNKILLFDDDKKEYLDVVDLKNILLHINIVIMGNNNTVILPKNYTEAFKKSTLIIYGDNNRAEVAPGCNFTGLHINLRFKKGVYQDNRIVKIGENCSCTNGLYIWCCGSGTKVNIGDNCMFATNITLSTTDWHPVYDLTTNERLNSDEDVAIGSHVWICDDAKLLKGAFVPDGCIVANRALVNRKFAENNCVIAGIPARQTKNNICWNK